MNKLFLMVILALSLILPFGSTALADQAPIHVDVDHMFVTPDQTGLNVEEILSVVNSSTHPYTGTQLQDSTGKQRTGVLFPLPAGFQSLQVQGFNSSDFAAVKAGVQIYKPLPPGNSQISLVYEIPVTNPPVSISKGFGLPTTNFYVYIPKMYLTLKSDSLIISDTLSIDGKYYNQYISQNLSPGSTVSFSVDSAPAPANQSSGTAANVQPYHVPFHPDAHVALFTSAPLSYTNPHIWAAYIFIMIGLAIAASILYYKLKARQLDGEDDSASNDYLQADRLSDGDSGLGKTDRSEDSDELFLKLKAKQDLLLERIKELDKQFGDGSLNEGEYRQKRDKFKELLVQVKLQLKELAR